MTQASSGARSANLLNVFGILINDALAVRDIPDADAGPSETAALITIAGYPGQTIKTLAAIIGLSHSATVRLIEKLVERDLVRVVRGVDRRRAAVSITPGGEAVVAAILAHRRGRLMAILGSLDDAETKTLTRLMEKIIGAQTKSVAHGDRLCRACDLANCPQDVCPVEQQACRLGALASLPA